jgi:hypothetical protein
MLKPSNLQTFKPSNLLAKLLISISIVLVASLGIAVPLDLVWTLIRAALLLWGGLVVGIAANNLFESGRDVRLAWVALAVGAYAALAVPAIVSEPGKLVDALGPVAALTLAAHLGRRDLPGALRDWALIMALALYAALGVVSMWLVVDSFRGFGPLVFLVAVLFPPLVFEAALLLLRRVAGLRDSLPAHLAALALSASLAMLVFSVTLLNRSTPLLWALIFDLAAGLLIGGALLVGLLTRPMVEAAAGHPQAPSSRAGLGRALVELSHGPILISLAIYFSLRLLNIAP